MTVLHVRGLLVHVEIPTIPMYKEIFRRSTNSIHQFVDQYPSITQQEQYKHK